MAIHNNVRIIIDLNELVATRGEFLFKDDDVSMTENQIDYIAERLRTTLTWDTLYHMVDSSILEFFDCHEHPEVWDPHYGEIQPEPGREAELNRLEKEAKQRKKYFEDNFEMVDLVAPAWTIQVPRRKT
jgi:hypothetical protein|tara:strand:+ start:1926 stop:2312 length:387 start_codon:yes stop_codon:yes gene_type:complete